ncbi:MAG: hypothetical protein ACYC1D_18785 [Acidimicrobiales bacterium]
MSAGTWTTKVDTGQVQDAAGQMRRAAAPITRAVEGLRAVAEEAPGFATAVSVNVFSRRWAASLEGVGSILEHLAANVADAGGTYEVHEATIGREFRAS